MLTMETEVNKVILLLDVLIDNRNNALSTITDHKLTYSGLLLNFDKKFLGKKTKNLIYINIYAIMKSVSQVLIQIVFLF